MNKLLLALCFTGQVFAADLPDDELTPGVGRDTTVDEICHSSTKAVRHTTNATKKAVYAKYGITPKRDDSCTGPSHSCYEIDHRWPLEAGGADVEANLWPQSYDGEYNAHMKDKLENYVHAQLCRGKLTLDDAHDIFTGNWIDAYDKYIRVEK